MLIHLPMKSNRNTLRACLLVLVLMLLPTAGCETDSNLGGLTPACLLFSSEDVAGTGVVVTDWLSNCDTVILAFYYRPTAATPNVWSAEFEIHFPANVVIPAGFVGLTFTPEGGDELESILGTDVVAVAELISAGVVEFGITKASGPDGGDVNVGEDNLLATIVFSRITNDGAGTMTLVDARLRSKDGDEAPVAIPGITFHGGEFEIDN
jgi:hypothetical protein